MRKTIGRAKLTQDELLTAVVEIEAVINSRPLSYISATDCEEPLTPSHLIVGRRLLNLPDHLGYVCDPDDNDFEIDASQLTKRMRHLASILNHFWRRWRLEYLNELRESHHYQAKKASHTPHVTKGDIVIIHDRALPRGFWKLGRIQEVHTGSDGLPRSALVRVATRDRQHTLLKRPLQLLYPLEICEPGAPLENRKTSDAPPTSCREELTFDVPPTSNAPPISCQEEQTSDAPPTSCQEEQMSDVPCTSRQEKQTRNTPVTKRYPIRAAARRAEEKRKVWIQDLQDSD